MKKSKNSQMVSKLHPRNNPMLPPISPKENDKALTFFSKYWRKILFIQFNDYSCSFELSCSCNCKRKCRERESSFKENGTPDDCHTGARTLKY